MDEQNLFTRRDTLKVTALAGLGALFGEKTADGKRPAAGLPKSVGGGDARKRIIQKVFETPLVDTHEHLIDERERLAGKGKVDDWSLLFTHYTDSDLTMAGMSPETYKKFTSAEMNPIDKWALIEPYWPFVKNTGYGQAVRIAMKELYGVEELSAKTVKKVQAGYESTRAAGFYKRILCEMSGIESCQVNYLGKPFNESEMPTLLMQDLGVYNMITGDTVEQLSEPAGVSVKSLSDWHSVIDWWFDKYGKYAVAIKSQNAYARNIDFEKVPAETAEPIFKKKMEGQSLSPQEQKQMQDHLFWYLVGKATALNLPVKLHTGYYAHHNSMGLWYMRDNPLWAAELCRMSPETKFVFMHICYPYYEDMLAIAKHWTNAYIDMCWAWIINPVAAKDFLKKFIVTVPTNKVLTFGGDYIPVELVLGHCVIARRGIAQALTELVDEQLLTVDDAMAVADMIMNGNARTLFNLVEKSRLLKEVQWS